MNPYLTLGILAILGIVALFFVVSMRVVALALLPLVVIGAVVLAYHLRNNAVISQQDTEPVWHDDDSGDLAA